MNQARRLFTYSGFVEIPPDLPSVRDDLIREHVRITSPAPTRAERGFFYPVVRMQTEEGVRAGNWKNKGRSGLC